MRPRRLREVMKTIDDVLDELQPANGWWKQDTEDEIREVLIDLCSDYYVAEEAGDIVRRVIEAVKGEYGG